MMIKVNNKKKIDRRVYFYVFSIITGLFTLVMLYLLRISFLYLYTIKLIIFILIIFLLFLVLNLRYVEIENSEAVLSIKEYHPMGGRVFPQFYRQVEIPVMEIQTVKVELASKKLLIFIKSKTTGKIIVKIFVLQYMEAYHLRKINASLKNSLR